MLSYDFSILFFDDFPTNIHRCMIQMCHKHRQNKGVKYRFDTPGCRIGYPHTPFVFPPVQMNVLVFDDVDVSLMFQCFFN